MWPNLTETNIFSYESSYGEKSVHEEFGFDTHPHQAKEMPYNYPA